MTDQTCPTCGIRENSDGKPEQRVALLEAMILQLATTLESYTDVSGALECIYSARKLVGREGT
jgi:hypothetical protein